MRVTHYTGIVLLILFTCSAYARDDADASKGYKLATDLCAQCHDISSEGAFKEYPPSFAAIAAYRSVNEIFGRIMYPTLHPYMPEYGYLLSPDSIQHLVAYIQSLDIE